MTICRRSPILFKTVLTHAIIYRFLRSLYSFRPIDHGSSLRFSNARANSHDDVCNHILHYPGKTFCWFIRYLCDKERRYSVWISHLMRTLRNKSPNKIEWRRQDRYTAVGKTRTNYNIVYGIYIISCTWSQISINGNAVVEFIGR